MTHQWLTRVLSVKPGELAGALLSFGFFFCVLFCWFTLRPLRDALAGADNSVSTQMLTIYTLGGMIALNPIFGWLLSHIPRRMFVPLVYHFFAACMLTFFILLRTTGQIETGGPVVVAFFVFASVFNLFAVSVFWAFMADLWTPEQATRLFGFVGAGGTLGAIGGGLVTTTLTKAIGPAQLLLIAVGLLEAAAVCIMLLVRVFKVDASTRNTPARSLSRGGAFAGVVEVIRSRYLLTICVYMLLFTITSSFLYFEQIKIAKATYPVTADRTSALGSIELWANSITLVVQLFITTRLTRRLGVGIMLSILPLITIGGFFALAEWNTFGMLMAVLIARRAADSALSRPSRELLYTAVTREEKYKAKTLIDTFVYRGGDALAAGASSGLESAKVGFGAIAGYMAPVAVLWAGAAVYLGVLFRSRLHHRHPPAEAGMATVAAEATAQPAPSAG